MSLRVVVDNWLDAEHCSDLAVTASDGSTNPADFPVTNLQSKVRDATSRSANLSTQTYTGTFGGNARRVSFWGIWPGLLSSLIGATVRVELFQDAAMTTTVYDSGTIDFFTPTGDAWDTEFIWAISRWGVADDDRTARSAACMRWISDVYVSAFRITLGNAGAIDTPYIEAERFWLGDYIEAPYDAAVGAAPRRITNDEVGRTPGGQMTRLEQGQWTGVTFETVLNTEADRSAWWDVLEACRPSREVVVSLFQEGSGVTAKEARDHTWKGSLTAPNRELVFSEANIRTLQIEIEES
jgi:hypothetical protein